MTDPLTIEAQKKTGFSVLKLRQDTRDAIMELAEERKKQSQDEILSDLVEHDAAAHQIYSMLQPFAAEFKTETPVSTLQALISAYQGRH
jgi:hypothetical protein